MADSQGRNPTSYADAAPYLDNMVRAGDLMLAAKSAAEMMEMCGMLYSADTAKLSPVPEDKLMCWTSHPTEPIQCGSVRIAPTATLEFLEALITWGHDSPVRHRAAKASEVLPLERHT